MLKGFISNLLFVKIFIKISAQYLYQYFYFRATLHPILTKNICFDDKTILINDKKRIKFFALFVPILIGNTFSKLKSKKLTRHQRKTITLASAIIPLFDDFFEQENMSISRLETLIKNPENFEAINRKEQLLCAIYQPLSKHISNKKHFFEMVQLVLKSQQKAQMQKNKSTLDFEVLQQITFDKGGNSIILFYNLIFTYDDKNMSDIAYQTGALIQYADDIFDAWFDNNDGIKTLANNGFAISLVSSDFSENIKNLKSLTNTLNINDACKKEFINTHLFFLSRAFVALNQLKNLSNKNSFNINEFSRKQIVCDMENLKNIKNWTSEFKKIVNANNM